MLSSPRSIAGGFGLALALSVTLANRPLSAQTATQNTADKKGTMQMPMNMPMGKETQKTKTAPKTTKAKKPTASKTTAKTGKKSTPVSTAKKRAAPKSMPMPLGAELHHAPAKAEQMPMADTGRAMHGDSAHQKMSGMKMQPAPAKIDSMKMPGMPGMPGMEMPTKPANSTQPGMLSGMRLHSAEDMMIGPAGVSIERMGSGTTWIPDAVTLPSRRRMIGDWMIMAHGFVFAEYDKQIGERGDDQFGSLNWGMLMATRDIAGGRFQARTMLSLDPFTVTKRGYPLLLQTGEAYKGQPLHDRQHPHDFWMELGALYQREISKGLAWSVYAAPSGAPALGPDELMQSTSAIDNPTAPLTHHWQDATHVSFGVLTAGVFGQHWKLEGSVFNGREPNEERWGFDRIRLDSYSGRFTAHLDSNWTFSVGYGFLKSPEALNPTEPVHRATASVLQGRKIGRNGQLATAIVWGANRRAG